MSAEIKRRLSQLGTITAWVKSNPYRRRSRGAHLRGSCCDGSDRRTARSGCGSSQSGTRAHYRRQSYCSRSGSGRPAEDFHYSKQPGPDDIFLIIEIADSSLAYDRSIKSKLYAETGVPEYWLADIKGGCLFAYSDILDNTYRLVASFIEATCLCPDCFRIARYR